MAKRLTEKRIARLRAQPGRYRDGQGLVLQVTNPNNCSWLFCYQRNGRAHAMGLGPTHTVTLKKARAKAQAARELLADGIDPLERRRAKRIDDELKAAREVTFKVCAQSYFDAHSATWSNARHRQQFTATMRDYVYPVIGDMPVAAADEPMILKVLAPIWKTKTVTAKRVRRRVAAVLDFAAAAKYRSGSNPARWEGNLAHLLPAPERIATVKHYSALHYGELPAFMAELRRAEGVVARAIEFTIYCAARTSEVIRSTWDEVDFEAKTWTLPPERMKSNKEHRVPLSDAALTLLGGLYREEGNPYLFIGPRSGSRLSDMAMYRTLVTIRPGATTHGFRSTFSTWAHETTSYPSIVIEQCLAHAVGTAVERAYRRGDLFDKRRKLMTAWAGFIARASAKAGDTVVPIRRAK
jgi:integrase